ncbi:hypothetical protein BDN72DRAFT_839439 [Pluteus cervinus]|uniref:Uncharacterized protein n=1 Tax=Pluteus cervinus TaxID=181527 RepID=A0ACD3AXX1_9AGAR|nr:hypothetical protein BDN72DRAFT_839439 [Pluteus cervinus]
MSTLPLDILDIIARLLQNETTTLKTACLVAHNWRIAFQPLLFSSVRITKEGTSKRFIDVINERPSLRLYVRVLEVEFTEDPTGKILVKLPRLEKITIRKRDILRSGFSEPLRSSLRSRYLTSLKLHNVVWFSLRLLNGATALKEFSSCNSSYAEMDLALIQDSESPILPTQTRTLGPRLRTLSLSSLARGKCELFKWLAHPKCILDLRELKTLDMHAFSITELEYFCDILPLIPSTLEHLTYIPPAQSAVPKMMQTIMEYFTLTRFTHLRIITFYIYLSVTRGPNEFDYLPWCTAFLSTLPNPSTLESIYMQCNIADNIELRLDFRPQRWNQFDSLLSSSAFPKLNQVLLDFPKHHPTFLLFKTLLTENLSGLEREGKLEIRADIW